MSAPESVERLYKRELGGGALLDIGVYPLSFIQVQLLDLDLGRCNFLTQCPECTMAEMSGFLAILSAVPGDVEVPSKQVDQLRNQQHRM